MNPYSEDELIEQPAINLLAEMGWETLNCYSEFDQKEGNPLGRQTKSEVVLTSRLRAALKRLNPTTTRDAIVKAIEELTRSRSLISDVEANREIYTFLKDGVRVAISDPDGEGETVEVLQIIDWENIGNNDFFAATQFWVTGEMYTKRPDLICFVNGIPLVLMEFKRIDVNLMLPITTTSGITKTPSLTYFGIMPSFCSLTAQTARSAASPPGGNTSPNGNASTAKTNRLKSL